MTKFPILYKTSKRNVVQQWQVVLEDNYYWTIAGQFGGVLTESLPTYCYGKNKGKSNETSNEEQALKEVQALITKQKEKGYSENILKAGKVDYFKPMLAKNYNDYKSKLQFGVFSQPKLDGIRCLIRYD